MRWPRRSARNDILRGIHLGKKGRVGGQTYSKGESSESWTSWGKKKKDVSKTQGATILIYTVIVIVLLFGGFFAYGYLSSEAGQRSIAEGFQNVYSFTLEPVLRSFRAAQDIGSRGTFGVKTNKTSTKKGIDLGALTSITGDVVPAGASFDLRFDIDFANIGSQTIDTTFYCAMNGTDEGAPKEEERTITGQIIPSEQVSLKRGTNVFCRIDGQETEKLDGAQIIRGWFTFPFKTEGATLPVYMIPGEVADQLDDEDFFKAYDLNVRRSDLRVTYNGEPISIAIGTGGEGDEEQPVIVRSGEALTYNTVGVTMTNEWNGDIIGLSYMDLILPAGVKLDDALNEGSSSCPFRQSGTYRDSSVYVMTEEAKDELFNFYISQGTFFGKLGKENKHTFQCWINIESDIFSGAPYVRKEYISNVEYEYKVRERTESVSIKGKGEALVEENVF
jgi:hypothetical protein